jgi:hypothetical protein
LVLTKKTPVILGNSQQVGGDEWNTTLDMLSGFPNTLIAYVSGSNTKVLNTLTQTTTSNTDAYTVIQAALTALPATSGAKLKIMSGFHQLSNTLIPPSWCEIEGESRFGATRLQPTGNFPAIQLNSGSTRTGLTNLYFSHQQSGYTTALLKILGSTLDCAFNGLYFHDNSFFIGNATYAANAIELNNSVSAGGMHKLTFINCTTFGFKNAIYASCTGASNAFINGNKWIGCDFYYPVKGLEINTSSGCAFSGNSWTNCNIQSRNSTNYPQASTNYTTVGYDFETNHSGSAAYETFVNCMVWDLPSGAKFVNVAGANTEVSLYGCTPDELIGGTGYGTPPIISKVFRLSARNPVFLTSQLGIKDNGNTNTTTIGGNSQSGNRTLFIPAMGALSSDSICGIASTQTLTNKTLSGPTITDATNIVLGSTTGTKIGTATTQKLGFFNATPVVQAAANPDTSGATLAALETEVNELKALLRTYGLMA